MSYGNWQKAGDQQSAVGSSISPAFCEKSQAGFDYHFSYNGGETGVSYHYVDTNNSGTPALPTDIHYIYSNRVNFDGQLDING